MKAKKKKKKKSKIGEGLEESIGLVMLQWTDITYLARDSSVARLHGTEGIRKKEEEEE